MDEVRVEPLVEGEPHEKHGRKKQHQAHNKLMLKWMMYFYPFHTENNQLSIRWPSSQCRPLLQNGDTRKSIKFYCRNAPFIIMHL